MCSFSLHARTKRANYHEYGRQLLSNISLLRDKCCKVHLHIGNNSWEKFLLFIHYSSLGKRILPTCYLFSLNLFLRDFKTSRSGYFYVTLCEAITARNEVILVQTFTTFEHPIFQGKTRVLCRKLYQLSTTFIFIYK